MRACVRTCVCVRAFVRMCVRACVRVRVRVRVRACVRADRIRSWLAPEALNRGAALPLLGGGRRAGAEGLFSP